MIWAITGVCTAVAAAVRSTWSPCGLSMLSTFTPLGERARGQRYGVTACWFVLGAFLGGALLGGLAAVGAALVSILFDSWPASAGALVAAATAFGVGAIVDLDLVGSGRAALPYHRRQVNEQWLDQFRRWITAAGFGLQIGTGLSTYIMSTGVLLTVFVGVMSGEPELAFALCVLFGTVRGLAVLAASGAATADRLASLHERLERSRATVRTAVGAVLAAMAAAFLLQLL